MKFKEGQRVTWDPKTTMVPVGSGVVRGVVSVFPEIGHMLIVQLDDVFNDEYPYSCLLIQENFLTPAVTHEVL